MGKLATSRILWLSGKLASKSGDYPIDLMWSVEIGFWLVSPARL